MKAKRTGDEIGKVSPRSGAVNPDPILPPTLLINCENSYVPSTTSRSAITAAGIVSPPQETASKGVPPVAEPIGKIFPTAYSFHMKEPGSEPITVQGFEGWAPRGFDSRPRITESGTTAGEPIRG